MSETTPFTCKQCGSKTFNVATEPKSIDDFNGAVCANCGTVLTEDEIRLQAAEMLDKLLEPHKFTKRINLGGRVDVSKLSETSKFPPMKTPSSGGFGLPVNCPLLTDFTAALLCWENLVSLAIPMVVQEIGIKEDSGLIVECDD